MLGILSSVRGWIYVCVCRWTSVAFYPFFVKRVTVVIQERSGERKEPTTTPNRDQVIVVGCWGRGRILCTRARNMVSLVLRAPHCCDHSPPAAAAARTRYVGHHGMHVLGFFVFWDLPGHRPPSQPASPPARPAERAPIRGTTIRQDDDRRPVAYTQPIRGGRARSRSLQVRQVPDRGGPRPLSCGAGNAPLV